jgi:subtilisin family serine protease
MSRTALIAAPAGLALLAVLTLPALDQAAAQSNGGYSSSYDRRTIIRPRTPANPPRRERAAEPRNASPERANPQRERPRRRVTVAVPPHSPRSRPVLLPEQVEDHPLSRFLYGSHQPDFLCVLMVPGTGDVGAQALAAANGLSVEPGVPATLLPFELYRMQVPPGRQAHEVAAIIAGDPRVEAVGPDYYYDPGQSGGQPADQSAAQFSLSRMHVAEAHRLATGNNVVVAVIDTGIDVSHPELRDVVIDSFDAVGAEDAPMSHGTAMAGVIASDRQLVGIAPRARLLSARAFGRSKSGGTTATTFAIIKSMDWAWRRGARVFNLSFAGPPDKMLTRALNALAGNGAIMVAAAGNAGPSAPPAWPAAHPGVIAVTATDERNDLYAFANHGSYVFIAAPGVDVLTTAPGGKYELVSGTSIAAAHVTGVVALMLERYPDLDAAIITQLLMKSSIDLGPAGMDTQFGAGLVDALSAVKSGDFLAGTAGGLTASD